MPDEIIINEANWHLFVNDEIIDGERKTRGLIPRNFQTHPVGCYMYAKPFDLPLIPQEEWQSRLDALVAAKALLSDIRNRGMGGRPIPSRDQNGKGYCWAHSSTSASLLVRAVNNQPYADLSAYAVACVIKQFRDEGGWGAESLEFIAERGIPTAQFWPQRSMSRSNDNPQTWENAKHYRFTEWMDLSEDKAECKKQLVTCLLSGIPVVVDYNWWSHSVCAMDLVSISPFRIRIWNSWGDEWSENGTGILEESKAIPDGALGARVMIASS